MLKSKYSITYNILLAKKMSIKAVLIDLSGTLHIENEPTPNAVEALKRLRKSELKIKFVTNTTKDSMETLHKRLIRIGFELDKTEIYSSLSAASNYVQENKLSPFYFLSDDAKTDFPPENYSYDSVVIGQAPNNFHFEHMNKAFNILLNNEKFPLIAIHQSKYFKTNDGLSLGPGCFVKGLEYSTTRKAITIGKPNKYFFENAMPGGVKPEECCMIGDDINDDIAGAINVGMKGILVMTGKYRPDVKSEKEPTLIIENFDSAVNILLEKKMDDL